MKATNCVMIFCAILMGCSSSQVLRTDQPFETFNRNVHEKTCVVSLTGLGETEFKRIELRDENVICFDESGKPYRFSIDSVKSVTVGGMNRGPAGLKVACFVVVTGLIIGTIINDPGSSGMISTPSSAEMGFCSGILASPLGFAIGFMNGERVTYVFDHAVKRGQDDSKNK